MKKTTVIALGTKIGPALVLAMLAGCSGSDRSASEATDARQTGAALADEIVVDPTMTAQGGDAASDGVIALSPASRSPQAIAAARKAAAELAGGLQPLPAPVKGSAAVLSQAAAIAAQASPAARAAKADCAAKVAYGSEWRQKLPLALPVYPQAAVQEAAGTDGEGCSLRVVSFGTPVAPDEVIGFYRTMALKNGYSAEYRLDGGDKVLGGRKGGLAYVIYARGKDNGVTEVDLVASGR